jgi:Domain of unknown function (DUF4440)
MRVKLATAACLICLATPAFAASDTDAVKHTVRALFAKANAGDTAGMLALCEQDGSIIDNFAPYRWDTFSDWLNAFGSYSAANAVTGSKFTIKNFPHVNIADGRAYAVVNVTLRYKENGKSRTEQGTDTVTLEKQGTDWKVTSFAWFGRVGSEAGMDAAAITDAAKSFASMTTPIAPTAIVDEFPQFHWTGPNANDEWFAAFKQMSATEGVSGMVIHLGNPSELDINGDKGYAVFPTVLTFNVKGKPTREPGNFVFAVDKSAGAWRITSWAWATK